MSTALTWLGHATWLVESQSHRVLIDPFLSDNPAARVKPDQVDADVILVTHGHFDHVADVAAIARRCDALVVANFEIATWFAEKQQVEKTLGMNLGGWAELPCGRVKMTLAFHSSQLPDGSYGGNPAGYILEIDDRRIYFAGDTALFSDMKLIGTGGLDAAVLPIGDLFTMGPQDSALAAGMLSAKRIFPSHYNTWPPIEQDVQAWAELIRRSAGSEPIVPQLGQAVEL